MPVFTILQLIFFATEVSLLIFKRSKTSGERSKLDKSSLLILWAVILVFSTAGADIAGYNVWRINEINAVYTGIIVFIIGFIIRWSAVIQLGKMFTVDVTIVDRHALKTNGLYNIARHPSYLGLMLIIAGLALCLNNWLSLLVMVIPDLIAINYRIAVEEKALTEEFGEQYTNYKARVKKLIPYIY